MFSGEVSRRQYQSLKNASRILVKSDINILMVTENLLYIVRQIALYVYWYMYSQVKYVTIVSG